MAWVSMVMRVLLVEEQLLRKQFLLREALSLAIEHLEASLQALIVQLSHLLTRILLHLDLVFKLSCIEQQ